MKVNRPLSHVLLLLGGFFMFLVTLFAWQSVTIGNLTYTRNAWHGFWGLVLGLLTVAFLVNAAAQAGVVEFKLPLPHPELSVVLAPAILVLAVIKAIADSNSGWASYVGIILAGVITYAAWLARNEEKSGKGTAPAAPAAPPAPAATEADEADPPAPTS
jgi:hypothetical protein